MDDDLRELAMDVLEHGEAVLVLDRRLRIQLVNRDFEALTKSRRADILGRVLWDVFPAAASPDVGIRAGFLAAQREQKAMHLEPYFPPLAMWTAINVFPTRSGGLAAFFRDISERKRNELERERLVDALREADRRKNEFLAMLSHELRNPLAPISNSVYLLEHVGSLEPQARRAREIIHRQVDHLTHLIDDLLDVTRISQGKFRLRHERLDLGALVTDAVNDARGAFERAGVRLQFEAPQGRLETEGDSVRLAQLAGNLLTNAAKFTPRGGDTRVTLAYDRAAGQAVLAVRDSGVGIAPDLMPRLFEPFTQANSALDRSSGGLGLGLALVKGVAELHGGAAAIRSDGAGQGTEVTVRLPASEAPARATPAAPAPPLHAARRVLIIEDNADAADTLRDVLELAGGHDVAVANTGPAGLALAHTMHPDVVLCDIGLPGMDGYQVAGRLRADPEARGIKLIALSGYAAPDDVARAKAAGFDMHLAKPPSIDSLTHAID
jgi:two-component system CheB/CheR fusion protein